MPPANAAGSATSNAALFLPTVFGLYAMRPRCSARFERVLDALVRRAACGMHGERPLGGLARVRRHREVVVHDDGRDADGLADTGDVAVDGGGVLGTVERDFAPCQGAGKRAVHSAGDA